MWNKDHTAIYNLLQLNCTNNTSTPYISIQILKDPCLHWFQHCTPAWKFNRWRTCRLSFWVFEPKTNCLPIWFAQNIDKCCACISSYKLFELILFFCKWVHCLATFCLLSMGWLWLEACKLANTCTSYFLISVLNLHCNFMCMISCSN